ncbi:hypothetical protein B0H17DRAFT_1286515 [Mycena rosella]|uniref:Uncharacterized protein n=1 Tax=Mycena rosella TaxID=1033263 RepID=A0AAD7FLC7_MYCRO|nr:hypothetical protein B0H17DRAFT_1286515 [Mycena rosella]
MSGAASAARHAQDAKNTSGKESERLGVCILDAEVRGQTRTRKGVGRLSRNEGRTFQWLKRHTAGFSSDEHIMRLLRVPVTLPEITPSQCQVNTEVEEGAKVVVNWSAGRIITVTFGVCPSCEVIATGWRQRCSRLPADRLSTTILVAFPDAWMLLLSLGSSTTIIVRIQKTKLSLRSDARRATPAYSTLGDSDGVPPSYFSASDLSSRYVHDMCHWLPFDTIDAVQCPEPDPYGHRELLGCPSATPIFHDESISGHFLIRAYRDRMSAIILRLLAAIAGGSKWEGKIRNLSLQDSLGPPAQYDEDASDTHLRVVNRSKAANGCSSPGTIGKTYCMPY